jgi:membrane protease YdiL (CAAX protease family)
MFTDNEGRLQPAWSFILSALLSAVALFASGYFAAAIAGDHVLRFELVFRTTLSLLLLGGFSWLLTVANHVESDRLGSQGLPLARISLRQFAAGGIVALALVAVTVLAIAVAGGIQYRITWNAYSLPRALLVLFVLLMGSLAEELMFRGYPFQRLAETMGAAGAILSFSVLFAVMHLLNPGASALGTWDTVVIGIGLAIAYLRTRSLWLPWGFHFAWNVSMGLLFGLPVSGLRLFNVVSHGAPNGPWWLTGGAYGPEASVPGAIAVLVAVIVMWRAPLAVLGASTRDAEPDTCAIPIVTRPPQPPGGLGL